MLLIRSLLFALVITIVSCKKATVPTENFYVGFKATLNGTNENPQNPSAATGTVIGTYNKSTRLLALNITWSGLTATAGHVYKGAPGTNGIVVSTFTSVAVPINTSFTLNTEQEADLMANLYYVNIHSAAYVNGEIRGQLLKQ